MDDSPIQTFAPVLKRFAPHILAGAIGVAGFGYAVHEHHAAQDLAVQNEQAAASLEATRAQLDDLTAKVNALSLQGQPQPAPVIAAARKPAAKPRAAIARGRSGDSRLSKMQSQLDAQGKAIDDTRNDLANTRTELTGSIARTHEELVLLEKKGERNYYEFDIRKSKQFQREGPVSIRLRKANTKHEYADLELTVEDRNLQQKHVNVFQPVMFYQSDSGQPMEIVINDITKDHIHGYVSAPKYRQSELASAADVNTSAGAASDSGQAAPASQPPTRRKLTLPN